MKEVYYPSKLSGCCEATTHIDKGGMGIFSLTQDALICDKCGKYTYYKRENINQVIKKKSI